MIESRERLVDDSKFDLAREIKRCHHSGRQKLDEISIGAREEIQVSGCYEELNFEAGELPPKRGLYTVIVK